MVKRTLVTLFSVCAIVSYIIQQVSKLSNYKDNILIFIVFIFPYILMNIVSGYFLISSMLKRPKDMNENIWVVIASFLGCNLTLIVGHFVELKASNPNLIISLIGIVFSIILVPIYIIAVINLGRNLTVLPEANKLNTKGVYRFSRHPLYTCYIIWYFTNILIYQSNAILITSIAQSVFQVIRAKNEEKILEKNFPEYADYKKKVWWIGRIKSEEV